MPIDQAAALAALKKNAGMTIGIGVVLIIFGVISIGCPLLSGVAIELMVGSIILVSGVFQVVHAFKANSWGAGLLGFFAGLLAAVCGVIMLGHPLLGLSFLTLLLAAYFFVDGIGHIALAFQVKPLKGWGWTLFGGVVSLVLGIMIWSRWPLSGAWAIGTLVGISIMLAGWSMTAMGMAARSLPDTPNAPAAS